MLGMRGKKTKREEECKIREQGDVEGQNERQKKNERLKKREKWECSKREEEEHPRCPDLGGLLESMP